MGPPCASPQHVGAPNKNPPAPACQGHPAARESLFLFPTVLEQWDLLSNGVLEQWDLLTTVLELWDPDLLACSPPPGSSPPPPRTSQDYHPGPSSQDPGGCYMVQEASKSAPRAMPTLFFRLQELPRAFQEAFKALSEGFRVEDTIQFQFPTHF